MYLLLHLCSLTALPRELGCGGQLRKLAEASITTLGELEGMDCSALIKLLAAEDASGQSCQHLYNVIIDPFRAASGDKVAACFANNASSQYFLKKKNRQVPAITRALVDELPLEVLRLCRVTLEKDGSLERIGLDLDIAQLGLSENLDEKGQQTVRAFAHIAQQRLIPSNTSSSLHLNPPLL